MAITDVPCRFTYSIEKDCATVSFYVANGTYYYEAQLIIFAYIDKRGEVVRYDKDAAVFSTTKDALVYILNELEAYVKQGKHKVFYNKFKKIAESNAKV